MPIYILAWFAVVFPLFGAGASFFADTPRRAGQICRSFALLSFVLTLIVLGTRLKTAGQGPFDSFITFFTFNPTDSTLFATRFEPFLGVHVDSVTAVLAVIAALFGAGVQTYASASLRGDPAYRRFFWASSLLLFAVLGIAYSPNLLQFWALSGVGSAAIYILMLHRWDRDGGTPARRVQLTLYAADLTLLLAVVFVFVKFGIFSLQQPAAPGQDIFDPFTFSGLPAIVNAALHHQIAGIGLRSLEVIAILVIAVALLRSAQLPFHSWSSETLSAPTPVIALVIGSAGFGGVYLLAREYPLLQVAPHVLSAVAVIGAATATVCAVLALAQRDIFRIGALISSALFGVAIATFGAGGFSAGLFALAVTLLLTGLFFFAAGNVTRAYGSRDLANLGGAWRRMPITSAALGVWAAAAGGLSLTLYYALASAFDNRFPNGGHLGGLPRAVCVALLIVGGVCIALAAFSLVFRVLRGAPPRRRGFQPERVSDGRDATSRVVLAGIVALILLVAFGIPGVGRAGSVGITWTQLLVIGPTAPAVHVVLSALGISLLTLVLGAAAAELLRPVLWPVVADGADAGLVARLRAAAPDLALERLARRLGTPFLWAGQLIARFDERVGEPIVDTAGEAIVAVADAVGRLRRLPSGAYTAGAAAGVGLLVILSLLAATGHLGGVTL